MRWLLLLFPIGAYCQQIDESLFDLDDIESFLYEIDESDESLIPWSADDLATCEQIEFESKAVEIEEEMENIFSYEVSYFGKGEKPTPTPEEVSEQKKELFRKPRITASVPDRGILV